jgi:hypothetical protein
MRDETIETQTTPKEPRLDLITTELQQAYSDCQWYRDRIQKNIDWWNDEWPGMTWDARKWSQAGSDCFPYQGSWDSRTRVCQAIVGDHVSIAKHAFWNAKVQCKSTRPLVYGRERNVMQKMLEWRIYTHMKAELLRELPMCFGWRFATGSAFLSVQWEQRRNKEQIPINLQMLGIISKMTGDPTVMELIAAQQPEQDKMLVHFIQSLSPICSTDEAKLIIQNLRSAGAATLPVAMLSVNKPKWVARRPVLDVLTPSETSDIQTARWLCDRELVSEAELSDRIGTDGYDPDFVEEALKQKGIFSDWFGLPNQTLPYRSVRVSGFTPNDSNRDLIELNHFYYRSVENDCPVIYKTIFNQAVGTRTKNAVYAWHGEFTYKHRQYPYILLRRNFTDRPYLCSTGIPEESYTDELNIKTQQDGLSNRTELIHNPPMIVPPSRREAVRQEFGPGAVMTASRPGEVRWFELSPQDQTPVLVMQIVQSRLNQRYSINGQEIDPEIKTMRRQEIANDILGEMELALEQTLQLMQQYEVNSEVQRVGGQLGAPWQFSTQDIQGKYEVSAAIDVRMLDEEYAQKKLMMIGQAMQFNQAGTANLSALFKVAMEIIDPDAADLVVDQDQVATDREIQDELQAIAVIMTGIDVPAPQYGNHQLRLQTLQGATIQSPNPMMRQRLASAPDSQEMLKKRAEFYMNQIQQYQRNPQIGRTLATQAFKPGPTALPTTTTAPSASAGIGPGQAPMGPGSAMPSAMGQ